MSSSIPIPVRTSSSASPPNPACDPRALGTSLPARPSNFCIPTSPKSNSSIHASVPHHDIAALNLCTSAPSVELLSRSARSWRSDRHLPRPLQDWDFSELVNATDEVVKALASGEAIAKRPPRTGVSGTYFFCKDDDQERKLAVFKPMDEEALSIDMSPSPPSSAPTLPLLDTHDFLPGPAVPSFLYSPMCSPPRSSVMCNPAASISSDSEQGSHISPNGFQSGEGAYREVAAYLLDHDRFARVPQTALVQWLKGSEPSSHTSPLSSCSQPISAPKWPDLSSVDMTNPSLSTPPSSNTSEMSDRNYLTKKGAFQVYVPNLGDADDFGPGVFDRDQVHRIAAFDIRTLNHDRHGGNILVCATADPRRRFDIIPIDHGYILPDIIQAVPWPVWMDWPMIREPPSAATKKYIQYLDPDMEARKLKDEFPGIFRPEALQGLKIATMLLQKGISAGLTLYDIGLLMYSKRNGNGERTELEKIVREATEASFTRGCHLQNDLPASLVGSPTEPHHRRHQSMTNLDIHDLYEDDFVVKYVGRRIQELVKSIAARIADHTAMPKPKNSYISRARSIPDFGIGAKPVHAIMNRTESNHYGTEVPASSPVCSPIPITGSCRARFQPDLKHTASAPINIPVADHNVIKINLPDHIMPNAFQFQTVPFSREANFPTTNLASGVREFGLHGQRGGFPNGVDDRQMSSSGLPPVGPGISGRKCKSSPVSTMEPFKWEQMSQR